MKLKTKRLQSELENCTVRKSISNAGITPSLKIFVSIRINVVNTLSMTLDREQTSEYDVRQGTEEFTSRYLV